MKYMQLNSRGRVTSWPSPHHSALSGAVEYHHDASYSGEHFGSPNGAVSSPVVVSRPHRGAHVRTVGQQRSFMR